MQIATMNNAHLCLAVLAATRAGLHPAFSASSEDRSYPGERLLRALELENAIVPGKPARTVRVLCQHIRTSPPDTCRAPIVVQSLAAGQGEASSRGVSGQRSRKGGVHQAGGKEAAGGPGRVAGLAARVHGTT